MVQTDAAVGVDSAGASQYRSHLDGLRSVAVYLVVAFHAELGIFPGGFIGVDIFFVLSGFLVTRILLRELSRDARVDLPHFYARRFRRILPAAAAALVITGLAYAAIASPAQALDVVGGFRAAFLYVANWHFISQSTDYFAPAVDASPVLHFWSLAVEEQFYFVWPLLLTALYVLAQRAGRHSWNVIRSVILVAMVMSVVAAVHVGATNLERAYYGTDTRAYQLFAGALLAMTPQLFRFASRYARPALSVAAGALLGLVVVGSSLVDVNAIWRGVITVALTSALIVALEASPKGTARRVLSRPHMSYLGRISYATYLWHWPIIILVTLNYDLAPIVLFAISAFGATALAALSYRFLEHPIRLSRFLDGYRVPVVAAGLTISFVAGLLVMPAALRWNGDTRAEASVDAMAASISVPTLATGPETLLDWRVARDDIPALPNCFGRPVGNCTVVHGTGPKILIMGDSLARMWLPTFTEIARRESLTLSIAAFPACPWQQAITRGLAMSPTCPRQRRDWYDRVVPELDPDIIVLGERGYDQPGNPFEVPTIGDASSPEATRFIANASDESIAALRSDGRKIVLLQATPLPPNPEFSPVNGLSTGSDNCRFDVDPDPTPLDRYAVSAAKEPDTWSLDLDRFACPRFPVCDPVVNKIIVRRDHTHLTATYARALASPFASLLHKAGILPAPGAS
jgi:peptidoglycan/LPS O-acetylase OafA/YrhL